MAKRSQALGVTLSLGFYAAKGGTHAVKYCANVWKERVGLTAYRGQPLQLRQELDEAAADTFSQGKVSSIACQIGKQRKGRDCFETRIGGEGR